MCTSSVCLPENVGGSLGLHATLANGVSMPGCNANGTDAGFAVGAIGGTTAWPPVETIGNVKLLFSFPYLNAVEMFVD